MAVRHRLRLLAARHPAVAGLALAAALAGGGSGTTRGDEPLVADRPTFSPGTVTVERGRAVVEIGADVGRENGARLRSYGQTLVRIGVYESIELRLRMGPWLVVRDSSGRADGAGDPRIGVKVELVDYSYRARPESALVVETGVLAGSRAVGGGRGWQPRAGLALAWELGRRTSLGAFLGAESARAGGERFTRRFAAVSFSRGVGGRTDLLAELRVIDPDAPRAGAAYALLAGATVAIGDDLRLDAWAEQRLDGSGPRWRVGAGTTWRPGGGHDGERRGSSGSGRITSSRSSVISRYAQSGPSRPTPERLTPP